jgi:hypothetical protein
MNRTCAAKEQASSACSNKAMPRKIGFAAETEMNGSHQDVVGLDVSVQHAAVAQVVQGRQHLRRISAHRRNVEADAAAVLLRQLSEVDVLRDRT